MIGGLAERAGQPGNLAVIPLSAVVKTKLTVNLVAVSRTSLCKRFKEEVALAGNRHIHGRAHIGVDDKRRLFGNVRVRHDADNAKRRNKAINLNAVNVARAGNNRHAVRRSVCVKLHNIDRTRHQNKIARRRIRIVDLLDQFGNEPETEVCIACRLRIGSNRVCDAARLVSDVVIRAVLIRAVQERELDVVLHRLHCVRNLKIQFVGRVRGRTHIIQAGKLSHGRLLAVRNRQRLLENLTDVRVLRARDKFGGRRSQRRGFRNCGLCRAAARGIRKRRREAPMLNRAGLAANQRAKRRAGVTLVKKHTAIVQQIVGSHNGSFIRSHTLFSLLCLFFLLLFSDKCRNSRHITATVRIGNRRRIIHSGGSRTANGRFRRFLHEFFTQRLLQVFGVFTLIFNLRFHVSIDNRLCLCGRKFCAPPKPKIFILHIGKSDPLFQFGNTRFRVGVLLRVFTHLPLVFRSFLHHFIELLFRIHPSRGIVTLQRSFNFCGGHVFPVFFSQHLFQIHFAFHSYFAIFGFSATRFYGFSAKSFIGNR
nr:MAG TPA: hypothetical protein [Caudoviricetes sp.]